MFSKNARKLDYPQRYRTRRGERKNNRGRSTARSITTNTITTTTTRSGRCRVRRDAMPVAVTAPKRRSRWAIQPCMISGNHGHGCMLQADDMPFHLPSRVQGEGHTTNSQPFLLPLAPFGCAADGISSSGTMPVAQQRVSLPPKAAAGSPAKQQQLAFCGPIECNPSGLVTATPQWHKFFHQRQRFLRESRSGAPAAAGLVSTSLCCPGRAGAPSMKPVARGAPNPLQIYLRTPSKSLICHATNTTSQAHAPPSPVPPIVRPGKASR